ncbi:hypothetical protein AB835_07940 [Candidatus Endobugula sertula]|uniref:Phospholipid/glycerol acyltransferase domain-containing protein n=1 Tax=Candidatus Endobugula sertula TaxID=62101 RepID=A0A1D2QPZ6_9GAMM|nr:hypothetical protein AB835_07940 [Candidatus Endobugula sertula]
MTKINKGWRLLATGLCFLIFGLGAFVLSWTLIPIVYFSSPKGLQRERRVKVFIHYAFRLFVHIMSISGVLTYKVDNFKQLNTPGQFILANHPSLIDVVLLIAFVKRADCIVKSSLLRNPLTRGAMKMAGYIANEDPEQVIQLATESLNRGNSLIIFPEGTRTTPGRKLSMRRGAANIALRAGCDITPVVITCKPTTLTKAHRWYHIPEKRCQISLVLRPKLNVDKFRQEEKRSLSARELTRFLENYFTQELVRYE